MGVGHHHHTGDHSVWRTTRNVILVGFCMLLSATGLLTSVAGIPLYTVAAAIGGAPILWNALVELRHGRLSADLAVCLAAGAAIAIGQPFVAAEVILIMLIGGLLEDLAVDRTRGAIGALLDLAPREATRIGPSGNRERVPVEQVCPGDRVAVAPGERIPVDGTVEAGHSSIDQSPLTGESLPVDVASGHRVLAGSVNGSGALEVVARNVGPDTAFGRMIHLVEQAETHRAPSQRLADRYATFFLPAVLLCAAVTYAWSGELVRAVSILVIACPCALVLATPTAISAGIGHLARKGVLVKGGAALEALGRCRSILLDKTGTLTLARLRVADVVPTSSCTESDLLAAAAAVEVGSEHPLGRAVITAARARGLTWNAAAAVVAEPGLGIRGAVADGATLRAGTRSFMERAGVRLPAPWRQRADAFSSQGKAVMFVARDSDLLGLISARDEARDDAREAVGRLRDLFGPHVCMLTGDSAGAAAELASELGIDDVRSELLPEDKIRITRDVGSRHGPTVMVGDGVNDAAALATADVGIALTDVAADAAVEAAGIAIFGERHLAKLPDAIVFARRVLLTVRENIIVFALGFNAVGIVIAGLGLVGPVLAAVLHQVSSLFVVANSLRLLWSGNEIRAWGARVPHGLLAGVARYRRPLLAAGAALYAVSGVYWVPADEVVVVRRFGRALTPPAGPGLHAHLPWPLSKRTRLRPHRVERIEIGFRTDVPSETPAPPAYEWNIQHRSGRYQIVPDEALMTCGDHSFLDINATVQYRISSPPQFLFGPDRPREIFRAACESAVREVVARHTLEQVLTAHRAAIEQETLDILAELAETYGLGITVLAVDLQDVHPPLDIVDAFRQVVDALEEKDAVVNRAQAYQNEQLPLARGEAAEIIQQAEGAYLETVAKAHGDAGRFQALVEGRNRDAGSRTVTDTHLYMRTVEQMLGQARLTIVEPNLPGRRGIVLFGPGTLRSQVLGDAAVDDDEPPETIPSDDEFEAVEEP